MMAPKRNYKQFSVQIFNPDVPGTLDVWDKVVPIEKINTEGFPRESVVLISVLDYDLIDPGQTTGINAASEECC